MTAPPGRPRPYQRGIVRQPRPDVVVTEGAPLAQLTIYEQLILLARRDRHTGAWRQHPVTPEAVAQALAGLPSGSGLLPPNTLASGSVHGRPFTAVYIPATTAITLRTAARAYTIPLPPLVWAGCGGDYRVWALGAEGATFPTVGSAPLYAAPLPNTYASGAICWGSSDPRPAASPASLARAWKVFLESHFNSHIQEHKSKAYPASVLALWALLAERVEEPYPREDLVRAPHDLAWVCAGGPWKDGA